MVNFKWVTQIDTAIHYEKCREYYMLSVKKKYKVYNICISFLKPIVIGIVLERLYKQQKVDSR